MTRWLLSWKTQATLAALGLVYAVLGLIREPIDWSNVITGLLVASGTGWLAVVTYRSQAHNDE